MHLPDIQGWLIGVSVVFGVGAGLTWLTKNAGAIPAAVLTALAGLMKKYVIERVSPPTQRMLHSCARAIFTWAEEELPDVPGEARMDAIVSMLKTIPYIGVAFIKHEAKLRAFLQAEWVAWDAEFKRRAQP